MEVLSEWTSKTFVAALGRFMTGSSLYFQLWGNNGTNFVGARRDLEELKEAFPHFRGILCRVYLKSEELATTVTEFEAL